jgi:cytochrome c-type biogenesis protein CcmF
MAPNLGFASLILNLSTTLFGTFFYFFYHQKYRDQDFAKIYLMLCFISFGASILSQIFLIYSFIISDYSVANVYQNSHHLKPLLYKIAGSWGNHEGSMLLLISVLSFYNLIFAFFSKLPSTIKINAIATQNFIITLFCAYTAITSNPFLRIFPTPQNGLGLNPILQDIGLALHPPMLYAGYLGFSLVFAITIGALISKDFNDKVIKSLRYLVYFSFMILTLGIALGSWWAYRELGWGGYWFWDPVENISLMPWLSAIALIHALKLAKENSAMKSWSAFLAIITMILCLLGIFLTRSGVLTSVHSFAISANRGFFIIFLISIIGGFGLFIFAKNLNFTKISKKNLQKNRQLFLIIANNYFLITALLVVLIGTIYPLLSRGLFNQFISIGASYYNQVFGILLVPFLIFFIANSIKFNKILKPSNALILVVSTLITSIVFYIFKNIEWLNLLNLFLAIYALFLNFYYSKKLISTLAHGGFLLILIGVIISNSGNEIKEINLQKNQSFAINNFNIKFSNLDYRAEKNFIARIGVFEVTKNNQIITTLKPELRLYPINDRTTNESAIYHHPLYDLYVVIGTKDEAENYAIRAYFKPMISLIWIGVALIFFGILSRFLKIFTKNF